MSQTGISSIPHRCRTFCIRSPVIYSSWSIYRFSVTWAARTGISRYLCATQGTKIHLLLLCLTQSVNVRRYCFLLGCNLRVQLHLRQGMGISSHTLRDSRFNIVRTVVRSGYPYHSLPTLQVLYLQPKEATKCPFVKRDVLWYCYYPRVMDNKASALFLSYINSTQLYLHPSQSNCPAAGATGTLITYRYCFFLIPPHLPKHFCALISLLRC